MKGKLKGRPRCVGRALAEDPETGELVVLRYYHLPIEWFANRSKQRKGNNQMVTRVSKPRYEGDFRAQQPPGAMAPGSIAPTSTMPQPMPRKLDTARSTEQVSGVSSGRVSSRPTNNGAPPSAFRLPDQVSAAQIRTESFKYGGQR